MALIMTNGMFGTSWAFYVGLTALGCGGLVTQGVALGWDMAAPLALNVAGVGDGSTRSILCRAYSPRF